MLRIYKHTSPYEFKDFETHLFNTLRPQFDHANDKLIVEGVEYRISTINYIGLFNKLLDNQVTYTLTFGQNDNTYAVLANNADFSLFINPKLAGCLVAIKLKKTTDSNLLVKLPAGSYGRNIVNNEISLSGATGTVYLLQAIYENGEYDWLVRARDTGYGGTVSWQELEGKPITFPAEPHTHAQLHDQNTDYQILYTEPTIPTYVFGASTSATLAVSAKEYTIHFEGADKYVSEIIAAQLDTFDRLEVYEDGKEIRSEDFSLIYIDSRYRYYMDNPFKAIAGKSYSLRFFKSNGTAQGITLYTASTYNEQGIPYNSVPFTTDYIDNNNVEHLGLAKTHLYFLRGSEFAKVIADKSEIRVYAETLEVNANAVVRKNLIVEGNIIQQGQAYETHAEQLFSTKDMLIMREGALAGLASNELSGFRVLYYDGVNNLILAVGNDGVARIGDESCILQALATREDFPLNGGFAKWNAATLRFETVDLTTQFASLTHNHDARYTQFGHTHDYAATNHNHNSLYLGITAKASDSDKLDGLHNTSFLRRDVADTFVGKLSVGDTTKRSAGIYGIYDSTKAAHIWSMGTAYAIADSGANLGNLYGLAYMHPNLGLGTFAGGHQMMWVVNGAIYAAIGDDFWTRGAYRLNEGISRRASLWYDAANNFVELHNNTADAGLRIYDADGHAVFAGKVYATDFQQSSDKRLKKNIKKLNKGTRGLKPVSFEFRDKKHQGIQYGFIAQQMLSSHPELVSSDERKMLSIKQNSIIALLTYDVQQQKKKLKKQKATIELLQSEMLEIKAQLKTMMQQ